MTDYKYRNYPVKAVKEYVPKEDPEIISIKRRRQQLSKMLEETTLNELLRLAIDVAIEKSTAMQKRAKELMSIADEYSRKINS